MLMQRVITALIFAAIAVAVILAADLPLMGVAIGLLVVGGAWEWAALSGLEARPARLAYAAAVAGALGLAWWLLGPWPVQLQAELRAVFVVAGASWVLATVAVIAYPRGAVIWGSVPARMLLGLLVLVPPWLAVLYLRGLAWGPWLVILSVALVAFVDIGAYFAGRAIGGPKLMPAVSPAKTWAGFCGGLAANQLLALAVALATGLHGGMLAAWKLLCLLVALASVVGDLVESMMKRHSGIKDSGSLLPGHGGLFDRIDSLSSGIPVFALGLSLGDFWA